jgi:hypothetical protein
MGDSEIAALKTVFAANRDWAEWSNFAVIAGLVVEMIVLWIFSHGKGESIFLTIAVLIIGVGVFGEYRFGSRAADAASELQRISDERVASLGRDAAEAKERAANAEKGIVEARLELERMKSERIIQPKQAANLIAKLLPYAGKRFWIITQKSTVGTGSEPVALAEQISKIFSDARWVKDSHTMIDANMTTPEFIPVGDRGCNVETSQVPPGPELNRLVAEGLKDAGIECSSNLTDQPMRPDAIEILIGLR